MWDSVFFVTKLLLSLYTVFLTTWVFTRLLKLYKSAYVVSNLPISNLPTIISS